MFPAGVRAQTCGRDSSVVGNGLSDGARSVDQFALRTMIHRRKPSTIDRFDSDVCVGMIVLLIYVRQVENETLIVFTLLEQERLKRRCSRTRIVVMSRALALAMEGSLKEQAMYAEACKC